MVESTTSHAFSEFTYKTRVTEGLKVLPGDNAKTSVEEAR